MSKPLYPPMVEHAKALAKQLNAEGVIILAFTDERSSCASYGTNGRRCGQMARLLDRICDRIDTGELPIWED